MIFTNTKGYVAGKKFESKGIHHETEAEIYYKKLIEDYYMPEYKYTTKSELIQAISGKRTLLKKGCSQLTAADKLIGIACDKDAMLSDQPISVCYSPELLFQKTQLFLYFTEQNPIMYPRKGFYPRIRDLVAHLLASDSSNISAWSFEQLPSADSTSNTYFKQALSVKKTAYEQLCILGFNSEYSAEDNCYLFCFKTAICNRKLHLRAGNDDENDQHMARIKENKDAIEIRIKNIAKQCYTTYCVVTSSAMTFSKYFDIFRPAAQTLFCYDYLWPHYTSAEVSKDFIAEVSIVFNMCSIAFKSYEIQQAQTYAQMYLSSDRNSVRKRAAKVLGGAAKPKKLVVKVPRTSSASPESMVSRGVVSDSNSIIDKLNKMEIVGQKKTVAEAAKGIMKKKLVEKANLEGKGKPDKSKKPSYPVDPLDTSARDLDSTFMVLDTVVTHSSGKKMTGSILNELKNI
jgi:hypothetical protein